MKITAYYVDSGGHSYGPMSGRASSAKYHREARAIGKVPKIRCYEYRIEYGDTVLFHSQGKWFRAVVVSCKPMEITLNGVTFGVEPWNLKPLKAAHE